MDPDPVVQRPTSSLDAVRLRLPRRGHRPEFHDLECDGGRRGDLPGNDPDGAGRLVGLRVAARQSAELKSRTPSDRTIVSRKTAAISARQSRWLRCRKTPPAASTPLSAVL